MHTTSITSHEELDQFTVQVLEELVTAPKDRAFVLGLIGELGAGKTAFVQHLAKHLGVRDTVTSPTYVIMRSYQCEHPLFHTLVHIDAYRIESLAELAPLRFAGILEMKNTLVCIEWADQIKEALPPTTQYLTLLLQLDGVRTIETG